MPSDVPAGSLPGPVPRPVLNRLGAAALALGLMLALTGLVLVQRYPELLDRVDSDPRLWAVAAGILAFLLAGLILGRGAAAPAAPPERDMRRLAPAAEAPEAIVQAVASESVRVAAPVEEPAADLTVAALLAPLALEDLSLLDDAIEVGDADTAWQAAMRLRQAGRDLGAQGLAAAAAAVCARLDGSDVGDIDTPLERLRQAVASL